MVRGDLQRPEKNERGRNTMKKVLIAVDGTRHSKGVLSAFYNLVSPPDEVILLHVEKPGGKSLMYEMLGEAEMSTLKEMLEGTEYKDKMDERAQRILAYYRKELGGKNGPDIRAIVREGHPAEEISRAAGEEGAELIILGYSGRTGLNRLIAGSVARDVEKISKVPVLLAKSVPVCEEPYTWRDAYAAMLACTIVMLGMFIFSIFI